MAIHRNGKTVLILLSALLAASLLESTGCSRAFVGHAAADNRSLLTVAVVRVGRQPISRRVVLEAELEPFQEVDIRAKVAGYVKNISVDIGSRVKQGQLLASLTVPELESDLDQAAATVTQREAEVSRAQEQLKLAQAAYSVAHLTYQRLSSVNQEHPGLVAEQEVDDALGRDQQAQAQVSADKAALAASEAALTESKGNQRKVQAVLDYAKIEAPFTGVITKRYVHTGTMVPAGITTTTQGTPVVRISQTDPLRLVIYVPASMVPGVHAGTPVTIHLGSQAKTLNLVITRTAGAVDVASRTMRAEVDVPNPQMVLVPGEYAQVELPVEQNDDALVVPVEAVDRNGDEASLWVVNGTHSLELRRIKLGIESSGQAEVTSGVSENELVVVGQRSTLQAGEQVIPKMEEPANLEEKH
jgi:RND family efflux transporter MFP subunit